MKAKCKQKISHTVLEAVPKMLPYISSIKFSLQHSLSLQISLCILEQLDCILIFQPLPLRFFLSQQQNYDAKEAFLNLCQQGDDFHWQKILLTLL